MATIIVPETQLEAVTQVIFRETTTIGFRYQPMGRIEMRRRFDLARTPYGPVRMKVSHLDGEVMQSTPEYEDCRALALKAGVPLKEVQRAALAAPVAGTATKPGRVRAVRRTRAARRTRRDRRTRTARRRR